MNRLLTQQAGSTFYFSGTLSKSATVTIQGKSAQVSANNTFTGTAPINSGTVTITAKDYSGNQRTNTYQLSATGTTKSFTYDANGNQTGERRYRKCLQDSDSTGICRPALPMNASLTFAVQGVLMG